MEEIMSHILLCWEAEQSPLFKYFPNFDKNIHTNEFVLDFVFF